jgi:nicotinate phosphoribosyltransferase
MPSSMPPSPLVTSALGLELGAFATVRAAIAAGIADARAAFELTLRSPSSEWGFLVLAGIEPLVDALERLRPRSDELDWLGSTGLIDPATRRRLAEWRFTCDIDAVPEGSVVFADEAVLTVEGPFWQAQLVGGLVQSAIGEATAVATRFARLRLASGGCDVVEDGAAVALRLGGMPLLARAAFVGGAVATTSALAARRYGIPAVALDPVRFDAAVGDFERAARAWLAAAWGACVFRLDPGRADRDLPRLALVAREQARDPASGWEAGSLVLEIPGGDRLGVARAAARVFLEQGAPAPRLLFTGDVDERLALELRADLPLDKAFALSASAVAAARPLARYELVALEEAGAWSPRLPPLDGAWSSTDPGRKLLVRYVDAEGHPVADVAHALSERMPRAQGGRYRDRATGVMARLTAASGAPLRTSVLRAGKRSSPLEPAAVTRARAAQAVQGLADAHRQIAAPVRYPVGTSPSLAELKDELLARRAAEG